MNSFSLYLHLPFCIRRCRYCDFVSYPWGEREELRHYLKLLERELFLKVKEYSLEGKTVESVYVGGGTPSLFDPKGLADFLEVCRTVFTFAGEVEITLEFRPGSTDLSRIKDWRDAGINRLSVGVQSFEPRYLLVGGRDTPVEAIVATVEETKRHYQHWNMDLIYGWPLQDLETWQRDLHRALSFSPPHLSVYNLTLHPPAPLFSFLTLHPRLFPSLETEAVLWEWTINTLEKAGYEHYEISNFAWPGEECRHNLAYWENREYLGLGVAAWSYRGGVREKNTDSLRNYVRRLTRGVSPVIWQEALSPVQKLGERIVLGLRRKAGISLADFEEYPQPLLEEKWKVLKRLAEEGWLVEHSGRFALSSRGMVVANQVFAEIVD